MKILFITNGYPPRRWAGTETYTAGISRELLRRGNKVNVICIGEWETGTSYWNGYEDSIFQDIPVRRLNLNWKEAPDPFGYLYNNPVVEDYLTRYLQDQRPDVVHITSCETLSASVLNVVYKRKIPQVLTLTDFWFLCPRINLLHGDGTICDGQTSPWECLRCLMYHGKPYHWTRQAIGEESASSLLTTISKKPVLTRIRGFRGMAGDMAHRKRFLKEAITLPDIRITASPFVRDIFIRNGITVPIIVQAYGHDLSWLAPYQGKKSADILRIGYIGQITNFKGVHILLQATNILRQKYDGNFRLSVFGNLDHNPDYSSKLLDLTQNQGYIQFCGTYPHDQSASVFAEIDVLVVPSLWYDFPLIIYEAFATQTPVIATRLGGMAEALTDGVDGLLFERGNVEELAKQLERLLLEPGLLERLRSRLPKVKTTTEEVDELEMIYSDILSKHQYIKKGRSNNQ